MISIIDRYLEHARIFYFQNNGKPEYLLASADWMQRNFDRRVEIAFPVLDEQHQAKLKKILEIQLGDNVKGWRIQPDGSSVRHALLKVLSRRAPRNSSTNSSAPSKPVRRRDRRLTLINFVGVSVDVGFGDIRGISWQHCLPLIS